MGFIDYAWSISFQKDNTKYKITQDSTLTQPTLTEDDYGLTMAFPNVKFLSNGKMQFLGQTFQQNSVGKSQVGRLFRAAVLHLSTHTLLPLPKALLAPNKSDMSTQAFAKSLVRDVYVNAYLQAWYPDRFIDLAYANAMAYRRLPAQRISFSSARIMAALLTNLMWFNQRTLLLMNKQFDSILQELSSFKETVMLSLADGSINLEELFKETTKNVVSKLEPYGPFLDASSFPHTEQIGPTSSFTDSELATEEFDCVFISWIETMGVQCPMLIVWTPFGDPNRKLKLSSV
jgi:hypothetical protein